MLTPEQIVLLVETLYPTIDELNVWITKDLIKRLMARLGRNGELFLTATDDWQLQVFQAAGGHLEALQKELARWTKKTDDEIRRVFEAAGVKALAYDSSFYVEHGLDSLNLGQSEGMIRLLEDAYRRTVGTVRNFTRSTVETSQQRFMKVLDDAHFKVASGAESYSKAVQEAVQELATEQTTIRYPSGHTDTIETAVLRAVRTGVGQASGNMAILGMEERGWDIILVSAHLGARYGDGGENPGNHFWWQGKFYTRTGRTPDLPPFVETTGYGTGEGLCGWNCRHSFGPGDLRHNPYKQYDAEENKKAYDLSQKQRRKESAIRRTKQEMLGYQTAIQETKDPQTKAELQQQYDKTALTLKRQNEDYNQFCKDNDLKRQGERLQLARWDQEEARKSIVGAKTSEARLAIVANDATIKANSGAPKVLKNLPDQILPYTLDADLDKSQEVPNGYHGVIPKGTTLTEVAIMAGEGSSTPIRDLPRLEAQYPYPPEFWQKKTGTVYGNSYHYQVHWYENQGTVPDEEIKLKGMKKNK